MGPWARWLIGGMLVASIAMAQDDKPPQTEPGEPPASGEQATTKPRFEEHRFGQIPYKHAWERDLTQLRTKLKLTDEQNSQLDEMLKRLSRRWKEQQEKYEGRAEKIKPLQMERARALKDGDEKLAGELAEKIRKIKDEFRRPAQLEDVLHDVETILTAEQKPILEESRKAYTEALVRVSADADALLKILNRLNLNEEQQKKVEDIRKEYAEQLARYGKMESREREKLFDDIYKRVVPLLNEPQKDELDWLMDRRRRPRADFGRQENPAAEQAKPPAKEKP
ncbi:MAG: hypothetical protein CHACPFDD_01778 [Phycisphaerae bacterium]|nr:hypothetical protein [Phycisphaerae bacterium]